MNLTEIRMPYTDFGQLLLTCSSRSPEINLTFNNWSTPSSMQAVTLKSPHIIERGGFR